MERREQRRWGVEKYEKYNGGQEMQKLEESTEGEENRGGDAEKR